MALNKAKCEILKFSNVRTIKFDEGDPVRVKDKVKYLGVNLNDEADPMREIQERITYCMLTLKKLDASWLHGDCSIRQKINVFFSN